MRVSDGPSLSGDRNGPVLAFGPFGPAAARLGGTTALTRGTDRERVVRYATLLAVGGAAVVAVGSFLAEVSAWAIRNGREEYLVLLAAVGVAIAWVVVRTALAFRRGWQTRRPDPLA